MKKRRAWSVGDLVKLVEPKEYLRTGYPLYLPAVIEDIEENQTELLRSVLKVAGFPPDFQNRKVIQKFINALAYGQIYQKGFGGSERTIHEGDLPEWVLTERFRVTKKYSTMTGTYYGPSYYRSYEGESDYEPGGLDNQTYNTILVLQRIQPFHNHNWLMLEPNVHRKRQPYDSDLHVWSKRAINLSLEGTSEALPEPVPPDAESSD